MVHNSERANSAPQLPIPMYMYIARLPLRFKNPDRKPMEKQFTPNSDHTHVEIVKRVLSKYLATSALPEEAVFFLSPGKAKRHTTDNITKS